MGFFGGTRLIETLFLQDKWAEVIAVADQAGKLAPQSPYTPRIRYQGAVARAKLKQYDEAAAVLKEIIAAGKDPALVHRSTFHLAECLRHSDKLAESAELYKLAATTQKGEFSEYAHYNYGMVLFLLDKHSDSIAALTDFRKLYPKTALVPEASLYIGRAHIELKDYAKAEAVLRPLASHAGGGCPAKVVGSEGIFSPTPGQLQANSRPIQGTCRIGYLPIKWPLH